MTASGSAPRVRGMRGRQPELQRHHRFSPACAGNAEWPGGRPRAAAVQPRVCGECTPTTRPRRPMPGSAPRVRGMPPFDWNTTAPSGSAPRVRGMRVLERLHLRLERFSPACAGNARRRTVPPPLFAFSPACAGNARSSAISRASASVQPRVCGECVSRGAHSATAAGSAPRVRGMRSSDRNDHTHHRFSPACAGNAEIALAGVTNLPVQPRVCGECRSVLESI